MMVNHPNRSKRMPGVIESTTVETVKQLQDAVGAMQGPYRDGRYLDASYVIELIEAPTTDVLFVRIRLAESVI